MRSEPRTVPVAEWPALPASGIFPEVMTTIEVAQLFRYDINGVSVERAKRNVQWLVRNRDLPVLTKLGQRYLYKKEQVLRWLAEHGGEHSDRDAKQPNHPNLTHDGQAI